MRPGSWLVVAACIAFNGTRAFAQAPLPPVRPPEPPPPQPQPLDSPEQAKLERLAELMGSLSFLRDLCPPGDGAVWRGKMQDLLAEEAGMPQARERLAGAFNHGFVSYRFTYRQCTTSAELVIERAMGEGSKLARELSTRFSD